MSGHVVGTIAANSSQANLACQQNRLGTESTATSSHMYPLVTLAVTTLDRADYLRKTLSSVLAQDYRNLDILVSDNGSRDATPTLVQRLIEDDPRARLRRNQTTVPQHEHFNQCVQAARGEFFILLCDDDLINPSFISELVSVATRHSNVNVVVPANVTIDEQGSLIKEFTKPQCEVFDGLEFVCRWLRGPGPKVFANVVTVLGRTEIIRHFGGYRGLARGQNMDNLLFLQCAINGRVGFACGAVFSWRVYNRSYGYTSTPQHVAESSHEFVKHLLHDPPTVEALAALPRSSRKEVINGVRLMTAREFLCRIDFFEHPFRWECVRKLSVFHWNTMFCYVVFHWYYRQLRDIFGLSGMGTTMAE
jgi:glycosyltransferase involved in cell wall biosynthesis